MAIAHMPFVFQIYTKINIKKYILKNFNSYSKKTIEIQKFLENLLPTFWNFENYNNINDLDNFDNE